DLENDGDIDLVTANYEGGDITILKNLGSEAFDTPLHMVPGSLPTDVASADFDNDGFADLVVTYRGDNTVSILLNQGNGTFAPKVDYTSNFGPRFAGIFDLDQDGDLDLAVPDFDASQISIYKNQGNGTFDPAAYYSTGARPTSVAFADLDKDGDPDLVVANYETNYFTYLENTGNGVFTFGFNEFTGGGAISALSGDWNQDGWIDLAVTNTFSHNISVFLTIPAIYGVRVLAGLDEFGYKGGTVNVEFNLKNTGQVIDSFQVTVSDSLGWTISPPLSPVQLMPAQEVLLSVDIYIPSTALEGTRDRITLMAASLSSPASQSASLYVTALELCGDVNNDGKLNLTDIIYYVNFMFKDGPAPCNPLGIR
ncbi:MAG TPA: VCBS repeat-containing protein, partial [candidate division Zixibacteria bacterium]|nr:VCBS repeat-containing protein [candidate division Zixibacteria bacterium]